MFRTGSTDVMIVPCGDRYLRYRRLSSGSMLRIIEADPSGIMSLAIGASPMRRFASTAPPRCDIPCTSDCFTASPSCIAPDAMMALTDRTPCPPTPARMMSYFMPSPSRRRRILGSPVAGLRLHGLDALAHHDDNRRAGMLKLFSQHCCVGCGVAVVRLEHMHVRRIDG